MKLHIFAYVTRTKVISISPLNAQVNNYHYLAIFESTLMKKSKLKEYVDQENPEGEAVLFIEQYKYYESMKNEMNPMD